MHTTIINIDFQNTEWEEALESGIAERDFMSTFSLEWPAVIVVVDVSHHKLRKQSTWLCSNEYREIGDQEVDMFLSRLYTAVSRARVYCAIYFLSSNHSLTTEQFECSNSFCHTLRKLISELKGHSRCIEHNLNN